MSNQRSAVTGTERGVPGPGKMLLSEDEAENSLLTRFTLYSDKVCTVFSISISGEPSYLLNGT